MGKIKEDSNPSLSAGCKGLIVNPLFVLQGGGFEKVVPKWYHCNMKPYQKPYLNDHSGDLDKQWYIYFKYWDEDQ